MEKLARCFYDHNRQLVGKCGGSRRGRVPGYFADGRDLTLCENHVERWNSLHPFGPTASLDK